LAPAEPGFLFLEFDGLVDVVLERAIREAHVPTLAHWLESVSHRLVGWETDMSSQTLASRAPAAQR
jgi:putative membrane protein